MIKKIIPSVFDKFLRYSRAFKAFYPSFYYDLHRFSKYSIKNTYPSKHTQLTAKIISLYHVIEKGLIMPDRRLGYGKDRIELLITLLKQYKESYSCGLSVHYNSALKVLQTYIDIHKDSTINVDYIVIFLKNESRLEKASGGSFELKKEVFKEKSKGDFEDLVSIRKSIRNFSKESVSLDTIYDAIKIAQNSPSTCNRQSSRVYLFSEKVKIMQVLKLQEGSRGFDHKIDKLLMIGYDIEAYQGSGDRYSGYIDASLFAMSLLYALTYKGLGSVSLNWSKSKEKDINLRKVINIKESHNIVFFIGVGNLNDKTDIAVSTRHNLDDILLEL
ncbi:hypothetical protein PI23P_06560 [Polaribacter irgensii 23-P]|uniref:Nitroreductase domain-containing protein n=1 Tax=Polaribacter irgensii 23-P TaxID=313594 RepID=A4BYM1_9FLAO|nr:nitroreductase family protein [Polaribacter irgensii]EAR12264.1 hypothetical protein PI23P_06560 [Polaribacter irgensii 23-P]